MCLMRRSYVYSIYFFKKFIIFICIYIYFIFRTILLKLINTFYIRIIGTCYNKSTGISCFCNESFSYTASSNKSYFCYIKRTAPKHCRRYIRCSLQIYHFTEGIKIIKCSNPVRTYCEYIYIIFLYIFYLLSFMVLNYNHISKASILNIFYTFHNWVNNIKLSSRLIKMLCCYSDYKIIAQFLCSFQQFVMSLMK